MFYQLKQELSQQTERILIEEFNVPRNGLSVNIQFPARVEFGDFSMTFPFELAKILRQAPAKTAAAYCSHFQPGVFIKQAVIAGGGYINIHLDRPRILAEVIRCQLGGIPWQAFPPDSQKYIVEHTNINPNKAAHIGHLRNAILGDCLVRILRHNGKQVEVQNYIDNTGVQVADVVAGFLCLEKKTLPEIEEAARLNKFDYCCWDLYARVAGFYEQCEENAKMRQAILRAIEDGEGEMAAAAGIIAGRIMQCHLGTMERLGIHYDLLPRESDILHLHFWLHAFDLLKERQAVVYENAGPNQGCWVMKYDKDGQEDTKIIVRSNGTVTYTGKDIAYQLWKLGKLGRDFYYRPFQVYPDGHVVWQTTSEPAGGDESAPSFGGGDWVFNVIDARQAYTQNVVYEGVRRLGFPEQAARSIHFAYEMVALSPRCAAELGFELSAEEKQRSHVEVSGRRGLGVKADDLLDRMEEKAAAEVLKRNPDLPPDHVARIAHDIALGAIRYFMVKYTRNSLIIFDFEDALNFDGETGPYLQYSVVRARNILRRFMEHYQVDWPLIRQLWQQFEADRIGDVPDDIWELASALLKLRDTARQVLTSWEIAGYARYLYTISQKFSYFYNHHRIIGEPDENKRHLWLFMVYLYLHTMEQGLEVLGIPVPERM